MEIFIVWVVLCVLAGYYAISKGISGIGIFFVSLLLSPLIGFIIALIMPPNRSIAEEKKIKYENLRKCPFCAELVKKEDKICKHCGNNLPDEVEDIMSYSSILKEEIRKRDTSDEGDI